MNTKEICDNIFAIYEDTYKGTDERYPAIFAVTKMGVQIDRKKFTDKDLKPILETAKKVALTKQSLKQLLEEEFLKNISYLPTKLWNEGDKKYVLKETPKPKKVK